MEFLNRSTPFSRRRVPPEQQYRILKLMADFGRKNRHSARIAAGWMGYWNPDRGDFVFQLSKSRDRRDRLVSVIATAKIIEIKSDRLESFQVIEKLLDDTAPEVSAVAAYTAPSLDFHIVSKSKVIRRLEELTSSKDLKCRRFAFKSLKTLSPTRAKVVAARLKKDPDMIVRASAFEFLQQMF